MIDHIETSRRWTLRSWEWIETMGADIFVDGFAAGIRKPDPKAVAATCHEAEAVWSWIAYAVRQRIRAEVAAAASECANAECKAELMKFIAMDVEHRRIMVEIHKRYNSGDTPC